MGQNTSSAVMQQRQEARDSLDDFPTPPWATRALIEKVIEPILYPSAFQPLGAMTCWEPACNRGFMARPLKEYFRSVHCSDVHDYEWEGQDRVCDFLFPGSEPPHIAAHGVDWIITNPPFRLAEEFIFRALAIAKHGVAIIQRVAFLEGQDRYERLYSKRPPQLVAQFAERVPMNRGTCYHTNSTATAYAWMVWTTNPVWSRTQLTWIPVCREQLERPGDYMKPPVPDFFDAPLFGEISNAEGL
jgi:hypothetical protein